MRRACVILPFLFTWHLAVAQAQAPPAHSAHSIWILTGSVTDTTNAPLTRATVQYTAGTDTTNTLTADDGRFRFRALRNRHFHLLVTMRGYEPRVIEYTIAGNAATAQIAPIVLKSAFGQLDPVIVSRVRPVLLSTDTITFNTAAFPVRDGSTVEELLKRFPGIEVDLDGNVIAQGKTIGKVLVNGKAYFDGNVQTAIKNLPADIVGKIQIIDDYGDKARLTGIKTGSPEKIINIILKPDRRTGSFGHAEVGAGNQGKYQTEVFGNTFHGDRQLSATATAADDNPIGKDPSFNLSSGYADQWTPSTGVAFNATNQTAKPRYTENSQQIIYYPGQQITQQTTTNTDNRSVTTSFGGTLTSKPTQNSTLRISPTINIQDIDQHSSLFLTSQETDANFSKTTISTSKYQTATKATNATATLYYDRIIPDSKRRFSIQVNTLYGSTHQTTDQLTTTTIKTDSQQTSSVLQYHLTNPQHNMATNVAANYFQPLASQEFLELGISSQFTSSNTDRVTSTPGSQTSTWIPVDSLSLSERYQTLTFNVHGGYTAQIRQFGVDLSIDGGPSTLSGTTDNQKAAIRYNYIALLPNAQINWKPTPAKTLIFQYASSTSPPTLQQVTAVTDLTNPQYPVYGNPHLKPSQTNAVSLHFENSLFHGTKFTGMGIGFGYSFTTNPIVQAVFHPKDTSTVIQTTTYVNSNLSPALSLDYHLSPPALFHNRLRITFNGHVSQSKTSMLTDNTIAVNRTLSWFQTIHIQMLLTDIMDLDMQGTYSIVHSSYTTPSNYPNSIQSASFTIGARHILLHNWSLTYRFSQLYTADRSHLTTNPPMLTAGLQRDILAHNKASIAITGYNLTNSQNSPSQTTSPTAITQTETSQVGRRFLLTFVLKLQRFHP